jgi:hypothetical protein
MTSTAHVGLTNLTEFTVVSIAWIDGAKHLSFANTIGIMTLSSRTVRIRRRGKSGTVGGHVIIHTSCSAPAAIIRFANLTILARFTLARINETTQLRLTITPKVFTKSLGATNPLKIGNNHITYILHATSSDHPIAIHPTNHIGIPTIPAISLLLVIKTHRTSIGNSTRFSANLTHFTPILSSHIIIDIAMTSGDTPRRGTEYIGCHSADGSTGTSFIGGCAAYAFLGVDVTHESFLTLRVGRAWTGEHGILGDYWTILVG